LDAAAAIGEKVAGALTQVTGALKEFDHCFQAAEASAEKLAAALKEAAGRIEAAKGRAAEWAAALKEAAGRIEAAKGRAARAEGTLKEAAGRSEAPARALKMAAEGRAAQAVKEATGGAEGAEVLGGKRP
jgi:chromosome segregation ATPase